MRPPRSAATGTKRPDTRGVVGVVVAGGSGRRLRSSVPKQFLPLGGATLIEHAVRALASHRKIDGVIVVLPRGQLRGARGAAVRALPGVIAVVAGGSTRARSARLGVEAALPCRHVLVHDAARPLASPDLVDAVLKATLKHGAAAPALAVEDTVKLEDGRGFSARTLDRRAVRLAQTPQGARSDWLLDALRAAERSRLAVTDESMALEAAGRRVALVPGDPVNVKITSRADLSAARRRVAGEGRGRCELRVGTGFDLHRFGGARALVLGGVRFAGERGLLGHSDADVVLHAAMDAVLGAAALQDIGAHFPAGDAAFAGAASTSLARRVARLIERSGYEIVNVDLTLLAERPRIRGRVDEMRAATAACFGVGVDQVGLKATTLEGLGALGRGEGIACQACALLRRGVGE